MAYLHSDREQFRDAIDLAYEQTGVMVQAIEKDYYVTMLLRLLAQKMPYIVFKGGTSLSKAAVLLETSYTAVSFPTVLLPVHSYIGDMMEQEAPDAIEEYNLNPFEMKVQGIDRTLADKVFAICDYYLQGKVAKHSRHLYDIYKLLPLVPQDENFRELVKEVRAVRAQSVICPSALPEADVPELLEKIIREKAYKQDYDSLTTQLLEENVPYDTVIAALKKVAESSLFENS